MTDDGLNVLRISRSASRVTLSVSSSELFPGVLSFVALLTVPVLVIDEPVKSAATSTVNVTDAIEPSPAIPPRSHVTVLVPEHPPGSPPVTVSPDGSMSTTSASAASDGPLLVTFSVI